MHNHVTMQRWGMKLRPWSFCRFKSRCHPNFLTSKQATTPGACKFAWGKQGNYSAGKNRDLHGMAKWVLAPLIVMLW
jgi:hypothetical protein